MSVLYTIGYEGVDINTFVDHLHKHDIKLLVDVRENPVSRKPGFSKNKIKAFLAENNISYIHLSEFGSPKDIREKLHKDLNYDAFFQQYRLYISDQIDLMMELLVKLETESSCLMCFEHEPNSCHRSVLAEMLMSFSEEIDSVEDISCQVALKEKTS